MVASWRWKDKLLSVRCKSCSFGSTNAKLGARVQEVRSAALRHASCMLTVASLVTSIACRKSKTVNETDHCHLVRHPLIALATRYLANGCATRDITKAVVVPKFLPTVVPQRWLGQEQPPALTRQITASLYTDAP